MSLGQQPYLFDAFIENLGLRSTATSRPEETFSTFSRRRDAGSGFLF